MFLPAPWGLRMIRPERDEPNSVGDDETAQGTVMAKDFYTEWLGIPPGDRPPDHYTLLGVPQFCKDMDTVESATRARLTRLDEYAMHPHRATSNAVQDMMNAVARARVVLVNSRRRQAYDQGLRRESGFFAPGAFGTAEDWVPEVFSADSTVDRVEPPVPGHSTTAPIRPEPWPRPPIPLVRQAATEADVRQFEEKVWAHLRRWRVSAHEERLLVAEAAAFNIGAEQAMEIIHHIEREAEARARGENRRTTAIIAVLGFAAAVVLVAIIAWPRSGRAKREQTDTQIRHGELKANRGSTSLPADAPVPRAKRNLDYAGLMRRGRSLLSELPAGRPRTTEAQQARVADVIRDAERALKFKPGDEAAVALIERLSPYVPHVPHTLDLGEGVSMKLRWIPAGEFRMGSPESDSSANSDEKPQHTVTISPGAPGFYMGITEVTQAQWKAVMDAEPWKDQKYAKKGAENAASYISWAGATAFCKKLFQKLGRTVRLPTEAQWEYACRAGSATKYCFGDDESKIGDYAWQQKNAWDIGKAYAHRVARKKPNAWDLHDMHGNVQEWCADWYGEKYYSATGNAADPTGPASGLACVLRGGSWLTAPQACRAATRYRHSRARRRSYVGFRVVVSCGSGAD